MFVLKAQRLQTVGHMPVVVQKYGGTSVGDVERIKRVAARIQTARSSGYDVVAVVSAMGKTTDDLVELARQITDRPSPREMDMLLTAGERVSMALLAIALEVLEVPAVSYTGSQAGILTDSSHGEARITRITGERVKRSLDEGRVVIVAGFQGVDPESKEVTTLGRGGSDTTAVALAATLGAEFCEINTDVDGVFTADPRIVPDAVLIPRIGYHEMLEFARAGAGVLMPHSVEFAHEAGVSVKVRSSFGDGEGTWVRGDAPMFQLAGIAHRVVSDLPAVSLIGARASALSARAAETMSNEGIETAEVGSSPLSASLSVGPGDVDAALNLLHRTFRPPVTSDEVRR